MDLLTQLGLALGFATLSGVNLYLTVFVTGTAVRFGWVDLAATHEQFAVLGDPWILGVSGALFLIEFFADKIPWVDSTWDMLHTIVRPVGGIMLALTALGDLDPAMSVVAGLLSGGASLATHSLKAGGRLLINLSPEPVSNAVASVTEDGLVLGGLGLMALAPAVGFFVFLIVCIVAVIITTKLWGKIARGITALKTRLKGTKNLESEPSAGV
ncbi:DUF4126 domain-containing protein [bacterium]|nr:DUF4126 domain-containing protein [bacterium]MDA7518746.1 DUF4126 domain-containing protein [Akkermansiaceae bacterium]MDA7537587.1 DUF4126 domain-containing protein [Akkermansiaceae bacterium]MDA7611555.1 DUF4126 domain-containing protein [bacterium]MDA7649116.1 DUF4126 domain-containing protein [Akkermansiaceae bacterium]